MFFVSSVSGTLAQTPCSWPACTGPESEWQYNNYPYENLPIAADTNGCEFLVYYKWRECEGPPPTRDVEISRIEFLNGGTCTSTSNSAIINQAVKAILASSPGIFGETSGYNFNVTVKIPGCLRRVAINNIMTLSNNGCNNDCCENTYTLIFSDGKVVCTNQTSNAYSINCGSPSSYTCETFCNDMEMPLNTPLLAKHYSILWDCNVSGLTEPCANMVDKGIQTAYFSTDNNEMSILVNYLLRECDNYVYELRVIGIQILEYDGNWLDYEWARFSYRVAMKDIWYNIPDNFNIYNYFVGNYVNECWGHITTFTNPPKRPYFYPCISTYACCYRFVEIQRDPPPNQYIFKIDEAEDPIVTINNYTCDLSCLWVCEIVTEFSQNTGPLPKLSIEATEFQDNSIQLYPNPAEEFIKIIDSSKEKGLIQLSMYDNMGQRVLSTSFIKVESILEKKIDISNFPSGAYFYKIIINNKIFTGSLIILR